MSNASTQLSIDGNGRHPIEDLRLHPRAGYSDKVKGPLEYVLVHEHPSWLFTVKKDKRTRTGPEWQRHFEPFTADIKAHGVLQPVIAVRESDRARIVDGQTRVNAALLAGLESIPILIYECELTESQLVIAQLQSNAQRHDFSDLELAGIYQELMRLNNWNQAQLAKNINVNPPRVSKVLSISTRLCPEVQEMVTAGVVVPRAAYAISRLADVPTQIDLATKFKDGVLCTEAVEMHVSKLLGNKPKNSKPLKVSKGGCTLLVKAQNKLEAMKAFLACLGDAIKRIEKDNLPPDLLGGFVK